LSPVAPDSTARPVAADESSNVPTLVVEPYTTSGIYADPQIVYRVGESTYGAYPNREWALPLGAMLAEATVQTMRIIPAVRARVTDENLAGTHELVWRGVVRQFEEVNRGRSVAAAVRLEAALVRTPGDSVVWQGTAGLERPVPGATMTAIVATLSDLTSVAIRQLVTEARAAAQAYSSR
jgi:uncharacterized lipoprotein YmbA